MYQMISMKKNNILDLNKLYRLPWSKNDNPNGWLEITTKCNLECPGCYRGCTKSIDQGQHKDLNEIKKEILQLKKIRNCQTISISGGEPLLHPEIHRIVNFISKIGLNPVLFTNGHLLDNKLLRSLKKAGLGGVVIRIDSLKDSYVKYDEDKLNDLRAEYEKMFRKVRGITLIFSCVVDKTNIKQIHNIVKWFNKKGKAADILLFIAKRQTIMKKSDKLDKSLWVNMEDIAYEFSKHFPSARFCSYLGSVQKAQKAKWLWRIYLNLGKEKFYLDPFTISLIVQNYYLKKKRYPYIGKKEDYLVSIRGLFFLSIYSVRMRELLKKLIISKIKNPSKLLTKDKFKTILIIEPPSFVDGKRDICDSCPDAILHKGKLVPSCLLEEIKRFGRILKEKEIRKAGKR